nr:hypothetical protein [Mycoplasmopsis bovis]
MSLTFARKFQRFVTSAFKTNEQYADVSKTSFKFLAIALRIPEIGASFSSKWFNFCELNSHYLPSFLALIALSRGVRFSSSFEQAPLSLHDVSFFFGLANAEKSSNSSETWIWPTTAGASAFLQAWLFFASVFK